MALPGIVIDIESKVFDNREVIGPLSLHIEAGEFVALLGPSGCGKTTLLNLVAGLDRSFSGEIGFQNTPSQRPGYVFQSARLMPWLTVQQNLELVSADDFSGMATILRQFGLEDCAGVFPNQLSGGMRRRVALARAFIIESQLLLLDEPFLSLDLPSANQLRELLTEQWQERGSSIIFVTHSLEEALALSDRVIFLSSEPMRLLHEHRVQAQRPRQVGSESVASEVRELLQQYPDLLLG